MVNRSRPVRLRQDLRGGNWRRGRLSWGRGLRCGLEIGLKAPNVALQCSSLTSRACLIMSFMIRPGWSVSNGPREEKRRIVKRSYAQDLTTPNGGFFRFARQNAKGRVVIIHRARCFRFLASLAAAILTALCPRQAFSEPRCSVEQEQFVGWVTGRFTVGTSTASLTLPRGIGATAYPMVLVVEVSSPEAGQPEEELVIRSGYETVRLRDGAALHLVHRRGERLIFSVATSDGLELCSWEPPVVFPKKEYRLRNDPWLTSLFHITGEPIGLIFQHAYSDGRREFRLDGVPARILMESPIQFLLRDPHPKAGVRTLQSEGKAIPLRFLDLEKRLLPSSPDREVLELTLRGLPSGPLRLPRLLISNLNPQAARLACGIWHTRREPSERVELLIPPSKVRDGSVTVNCEVRLLQPKPASLVDFVVFSITDFQSPGLRPFLRL